MDWNLDCDVRVHGIVVESDGYCVRGRLSKVFRSWNYACITFVQLTCSGVNDWHAFSLLL